MILITGANGHLGSQTINFLLEKNPDTKIAGLVRSEEKGKELKQKGVELRIGDYFNTDSLKKAMDGVETLLLISSSSMNNRADQHKNVIDAAKEAGVKQIFYTSIVQAEKLLSPLSSDHFETEKILKDSGIPYTIYRNAFYAEFFPLFLGNALESGEWYVPTSGQKINLAYRAEMAEALANGLVEAEKHQNKTYELTSAKGYTAEEYAKILSEEVGKKITYTDLTIKDYGDQLEQAGLPNEAIVMSVMTAETFVNGALDFTFNDLENLLGRKPKSAVDFIKEFSS